MLKTKIKTLTANISFVVKNLLSCLSILVETVDSLFLQFYILVTAILIYCNEILNKL